VSLIHFYIMPIRQCMKPKDWAKINTRCIWNRPKF